MDLLAWFNPAACYKCVCDDTRDTWDYSSQEA